VLEGRLGHGWAVHTWLGLDARWVTIRRHGLHLLQRLALNILGGSVDRVIVAGIGGNSGWVGHRWFGLGIPWELGDVQA